MSVVIDTPTQATYDTTDGLAPRLPSRPLPDTSTPASIELGNKVLANPHQFLTELETILIGGTGTEHAARTREVLGALARLPVEQVRPAEQAVVDIARHAIAAGVWFLNEWRIGDRSYYEFWTGVLSQAHVQP